MGFWDRLLRRHSQDASQANSSTYSDSDFSDYRLVMALSPAVQKKFKEFQPEMAAAVFLAMTEKNRNHLVERPEGIYISRQCWEKMLSYDIWHTTDSQIVITQRALSGQLEEPKEDTQRFLNKHLPNARKLGRMNSLHYAIGLALTFGLDQNRLILRDGEVEIYY